MIDYVTLMLVNMAAGLAVIGVFILTAIDKPDNKSWAVPFFIAGAVATITGFAMTFTWPLPSPYNIAFGETSVMLGLLLLGAGLAVAKGWHLLPMCLYAVFAGLTAMLIGVRFIDLGLSRTPVLSGVGFLLTGLCGVCAPLAVNYTARRWLCVCGAMVLFAAAAIWLYIGGLAFWGHLYVGD